ncbi:hypothetical protein ACFQZX_14685 [Mucilaginibacter litoreus]|uniref:3-keto-disaccharide hydrolase domain-containing protein n=1 Tax=Mucilaginibacter litoreus TaxID=1048221 RepID=A0ABW3AVG9_9SPHI
MRMYKALLTGLILFYSISGFCQSNKIEDFSVVNRQVTINEDGSIHLNEVDGAGLAWINKAKFTKGSIEFDVKGNDKLQGSFVGIAFHGLNDSTYECVYFRPFNFLADDAVRKSHGVQYIALPEFDWPLLREKYPNKYELAVVPAPDPNSWFHVRITVAPDVINVYVNNSRQPMLAVKPLTKTGGNKIGYWVGYGSPGDWKNLKITESK